MKRKECTAAIQISHDETTVRGDGEEVHHTHLPDHGAAKAAVARHDMLARAREEVDLPTATVTQRTIREADSETRMRMPKEASLKRAIQRARVEDDPHPPATLSALGRLPPAYRNMDGDRFLIFDSRYEYDEEEDEEEEDDDVEQSRILMFATPRGLRELARSKYWYVDGTFKSAPDSAHQLYTVHYRQHNAVFPAVYILMEERTEEAYERVFRALKNALPQRRRNGPDLVSSDFELAAINAFRQVFPAAEERFCFFHFSQALWRKMQELGLAQAYLAEDGTELRKEFHSCLALAFVDPAHVEQAFRRLRTAVSDEMRPFINYVGRTYAWSTPTRRPRYPFETWNVYQRTLRGEDRTNNSVEAWHRRFNALVGKAHPSLYAFLRSLNREEQYVAARREDIENGHPPPEKKALYKRNDERILRLVQRFDEYVQQEEAEEQDDEDPWTFGLLMYLKAVGYSARGVLE